MNSYPVRPIFSLINDHQGRGMLPPPSAVAAVPGSKSITNRALLMGALSAGECRLKGCLTSEDSHYFLESLKSLGFTVQEENQGRDITIYGCGGQIPNREASIYVGSAGTAARFLAAMLAFSEGTYVMESSDQMKRRPMGPLIEVLRSSGATVECLEEEGHFPLKITGVFGEAGAGEPSCPTSFTVNIDQSSQFLSALLIIAGSLSQRLQKKIEIQVTGSHGLSYVAMTASVMRGFGIQVTEAGSVYEIQSHTGYVLSHYTIEPDMSAACYFYALAGILGAAVSVRDVQLPMLQGDAAFLGVLEQMGCQVLQAEKVTEKHLEESTHGTSTNGLPEQVLAVIGPEEGRLKGGFTVDMSAFSDQALTLAAIAPFADGPITITGIGHLRYQECDRIQAMADNLRRLGIRTEAGEDFITIYPGPVRGAEIETYQDHRVAMAFSLLGTRVPGIEILNPSCVRKTFAEYFDVLRDVSGQLLFTRN